MKLLLLLSLYFIPLKPMGSSKQHLENTYYYFCVSRPKPGQPIIGKQRIMYTDLIEISCPESYFQKRAKVWGDLVSKLCSNANGCTSDLNYYYTCDKAYSEFEKITKHSSEVQNIDLIKVNF